MGVEEGGACNRPLGWGRSTGEEVCRRQVLWGGEGRANGGDWTGEGGRTLNGGRERGDT